ncbi:hypothetical protein EVAR_83465_1 [Eumeta japonica]|uniref:Uncharacterized protein n=1 Tax=Eumeta variegata TaxID=151549 RepID=A0A4C1TYL2_EUMVA|nr:hypothetical protein EVAR_83465_1 [Eumeta japonica]
MLLLRLEADEEDSGDLIDCDNASHLSKTDKLEKRTVTLGDIEPVPESSPTTAPPPPPTACSEINSASLHGSAKRSVAKRVKLVALIYTETDPLQIMRVLERRFGRPDAIIKQELNKLRRMTPMNGGMGNISSFANKVNNCVAPYAR